MWEMAEGAAGTWHGWVFFFPILNLEYKRAGALGCDTGSGAGGMVLSREPSLLPGVGLFETVLQGWFRI